MSLRGAAISPPPAIGGLVMQNLNPFDLLFDSPYGMDMSRTIVDMVDETIGFLRNTLPDAHEEQKGRLQFTVREGYAFVAMPMTMGNPELDDVLDAIKEAAQRCGTQAERIDEPASTERITDRIIKSIQRAQFVIADLTDGRPSVYYEAGYAQWNRQDADLHSARRNETRVRPERSPCHLLPIAASAEG